MIAFTEVTHMNENKRVRICDIAEELGISTATVSNVIHGKTKKISDETVKRVQQLIEEWEYIPSMAGILLAQNDSKIVGVIINNNEKYNGHVLEDPFISSAVNHLSTEIENSGFFMMIKTTTECSDIIKFASMWNLTGMVLIGFCEQDYNKIRESIHIPFVVYDGYMDNSQRICNIVIDNFDGGYQVGKCLTDLGHQKLLCIADNEICMDWERYKGFCKAVDEANGHADFLKIPMNQSERYIMYENSLDLIKEHTAIFAVSDYYAVDIMLFLIERGVKIPDDISIIGFDDTPICKHSIPSLTSVRQDCSQRARIALETLQKLKSNQYVESEKNLPVTLIKRNSIAKCTKF